MKINKNKKGFSLVELIVVIAVMAVLVGVIVPVFWNSVEKSRKVIDDVNVSMLNRVTQVYAVNEEKDLPDIFEGIDTDAERMDILVDKNYITKVAVPMVSDAEFLWSVAFQEWYSSAYLTNENNNSILSYIFGGTSLEDYVTTDRWEITEDGAVSHYGRMFIGNPNEEYTIQVNATLDEGGNGGYGIFFDTKYEVDSNLDTGYILQFDRGANGLRIDRRDGKNTYQGGTGDRFTHNDISMIPVSNTDPWWTEPHEVTLEVKVIDAANNIKTVDVKIDGETVITNYEFESDVTSVENQTGFRSWGQDTLYENMTITGTE